MANDVSCNPMHLDTSGASVLWPVAVKIVNITWSNYTPGTLLTALVQDANGKDLLNAIIPAAQTEMMPIQTGFIGWTRGIKLTTLSGTTPGEILVSIGAGK